MAKTGQNRPERSGDSAERRNLEDGGNKCGFLPKADTTDNSPAIYGWDWLPVNIRVPAGTEETSLSSLTGLVN